jgi:hypothetical protein
VAIAKVRCVRPGAIETRDQEKFLLDLHQRQEVVGRATRHKKSREIKVRRRAGQQTLFERLGIDWFERLTGFRETSYEKTRAKLEVEGTQLKSLVNGCSYGIGELELVSLATLRERVQAGNGLSGRLKIGVVTGDVRQMHRLPENAGALFQVASQFNLLEMASPSVTPEHGVTRYQHDHTQGPACAIACGAATIYRNYFAKVGDAVGQTAARQLDGLAGIGKALAHALDKPTKALWEMRNGYALCSRSGLDMISQHLKVLNPAELDDLRGKLSIGIHRDVEVTDAPERSPQVSQAFCSALPVAYTGVALQWWKEFASVILEAAYEATILAAIINARRGASKVTLLTQLGEGAFGNCEEWIHNAMSRALKIGSGFDLEVKLVTYSGPSRTLLRTVEAFS